MSITLVGLARVNQTYSIAQGEKYEIVEPFLDICPKRKQSCLECPSFFGVEYKNKRDKYPQGIGYFSKCQQLNSIHFIKEVCQ